MRVCPQCHRRVEQRICPTCRITTVDEGALRGEDLVGRVFADKYEVLALLGRGGMGAVYRARNIALDSPVALKVLRREASEDLQAIERFYREARAASRLRHPNTIRVFDFGQSEDDGRLFLAMEYLEGTTVAAEVRREGRLDEERILRIVEQVCMSLAEAHGTQPPIVHRDVKPANVFLTHQVGLRDFVKVLDFGIAKLAGEESLTRSAERPGTPPYMSPEQCLGKPLDGRSDLYSLGAMMYEMASGSPPFQLTLCWLAGQAQAKPAARRPPRERQAPAWPCSAWPRGTRPWSRDRLPARQPTLGAEYAEFVRWLQKGGSEVQFTVRPPGVQTLAYEIPVILDSPTARTTVSATIPRLAARLVKIGNSTAEKLTVRVFAESMGPSIEADCYIVSPKSRPEPVVGLKAGNDPRFAVESGTAGWIEVLLVNTNKDSSEGFTLQLEVESDPCENVTCTPPAVCKNGQCVEPPPDCNTSWSFTVGPFQGMQIDFTIKGVTIVQQTPDSTTFAETLTLGGKACAAEVSLSGTVTNSGSTTIDFMGAVLKTATVSDTTPAGTIPPSGSTTMDLTIQPGNAPLDCLIRAQKHAYGMNDYEVQAEGVFGVASP